MDRRKHILIVDDVTTNLKLASDVLQDKYRLSMAKSGRQALDFLDKAKPDLILLDVRMPDMDGYETLENIKANPETAGIPVVFLTVDDQRESEIKGLKMGAMDFILKPFEPEVMLSRIEKILQIEDLRKNLTNSARKDSLTGLWNRKYLEEDVEKYLAGNNAKGAFLVMDIDRFKIINDSYGHMVGDRVITEFANLINGKVGPRDIAARLGGDEFVIFLKGQYTYDEIVEYCSIILKEVNDNISALVQGSDVTASIGIAMVPEDGMSFGELYANGDKALYYVKQNGKNNYHFYRQHEMALGTSENGNFDSSNDMKRLENLIKEHTDNSGAYKVEYDSFSQIIKFVSRSITRTGEEVQLLLLTLVHDSGVKLSMEKLEQSLKELERAVVVSLRQGDVATQFSAFQYVVLLMNTDADDAKKISQRIISTWNEINDNKFMKLECKFKTLDPKNKDI